MDRGVGVGVLSQSPWNVRTQMFRGAPYFRATDVAEALGYKNARNAVLTHVAAKHSVELKDLEPEGQLNARTWQGGQGSTKYLTVDGVKSLAQKSRMTSAMQLAEDLDFANDTKYVHKEQEIVKHLIDFLSELCVVTEYQKQVGRYRIDVYLPDYKLAFEVDENGHKDRDAQYERCREEFIRRTLGCDFLRVNPDAPDFNIFKVCAQLSSKIMARRDGGAFS